MKKNILIIDDSLPIRLLLEAVLSKTYNVISAEDGLAAMAWLSKGNKPDLIVTDLQMPNIDGWELVNYFANSLLYKDIPVIVLSAYADQSKISEISQNSNVYKFLIKPFDPTHLLKAIEMLFSKNLTPIFS